MKFIIKNIRAVGMHHHGPPDLMVNGLKWEPENLEDLGNAIAVHDRFGKRRAYLTRSDAKAISTLFYGNAIENSFMCIPVSQSQVISPR